MQIRIHDHHDERPQSALSKVVQAEIREGLHRWRDLHEGSELSEPVDPTHDHVCGEADAPMMVVEYGSIGSWCGSREERALRATLREWIEEGKICLAFRHFPLIDSHPGAWLGAQAIEAAGCQSRFWDMQAALTEALTGPWSKSLDRREIEHIARRLELDVRRLEQDMERASTVERILRDFKSGVRSGVNGAPTFYAQGVRQDIDGPDELHARLEKALAGDPAALWPPLTTVG